MTQKRHISPPAGKVADDALLDAARSCVLEVGVSRTTLAGIARAAGVSRMTVYRRFPDLTALLVALLTREFGSILDAAELAAADRPTARARLVTSALSAVRALAADPVMRTVVDRDAQLLVPYLVERIGSSQKLAEAYLGSQVAAGHADGSIRVADTSVQVRSIFLVLQSFVLSIGPATTDLGFDDLLAELGLLLDAALRPAPPEGGP